MSASLIVTIAVILFLLIFLAVGCARGFLRIILTTFSLVITLILAGALAGPLSDFAENGTVIGQRVRDRIEEYVSGQMTGISENAQDAQDAVIRGLPLPASLKQDLIDNNTVAGYVEKGVSSFTEYISVSLSHLVIRILSYILLFIVIFLIIRLILRLSNLINHVPLLGGVNRLFGGVMGLAEGVLFLWIICLIIMMMAGTPFGARCEEIIKDSVFLTFIYEHNYLMVIVSSIARIFSLRS